MSGRLLAAGLAVALAVSLGVYAANGLVRVHRLRAEVRTTEREVGTLHEQSRRLGDTAERLRNDPAYVEKIAREEHGLVREGERVLKFTDRGR